MENMTAEWWPLVNSVAAVTEEDDGFGVVVDGVRLAAHCFSSV